MNLKKVIDDLKDHYRRYGLKATMHDLGCRLANSVVHFEILRGMVVR